MAVFFLFAMMLVFMLIRVHVIFGQPAKGKLEKAVLLSFPEKTLMQRTNVYAIGLVLVLTTVTGIISGTFEIIVVLVAGAILVLPVQCRLTSEGVALNKVVFRPWREFSGFRLEKRRIVLLGQEGLRPMNLYLMGAHQKEVAAVLRRHLREIAKVPRVVTGRTARVS